MTPADLYRDCRVSAWRVEALQHYTVPGDDERQRAFHAGEPLPPPRQGKQDDLALIAKLHRAGRQVGRVHVVDWPLSDYVHYELAVYAENAAAGEEIRIADRSQHPDLAAVTLDFVIFDTGTPQVAVVLFEYDDAGLVRGYQVASDLETVEQCERQLELALARSVRLETFTAATATR
jgi:hypothetical protein